MKRWLFLALAMMLLLAGSALWLVQIYETKKNALYAAMPLTTENEFTITPGTSFRRIAVDMAALDWVESARFLELHARLEGLATSVKAGTYAVTPGMSAMEAIALFVSGREIQYPFTIVEGWTFRDLRAALGRDSRLRQTLTGLDATAVMAALEKGDRHPEGMFLADTYLYGPGASDRDVLARALAAMERALATGWEKRAKDLPLKNPYEALILASIIEKETAAARERPVIAGVFVQRLRRGMLLQTDPTVIYGMGERFDGNIRRKDLRTDTPYNTYTRKGLPPTPIAMVGPKALQAALSPQVDGSLYFVSRGDGTHQFSRTYTEHLRAVRKFQLGGSRARKPAGG